MCEAIIGWIIVDKSNLVTFHL